MNVCMTTGVQGYMRSGFPRAALNAAQYVRLASEGRKWFWVLHLGQRGRSAAISHVFHSEHVKKANHFNLTLTLSSISCNLWDTNQTTHLLSFFPLGDIYEDKVSSINDLMKAKNKTKQIAIKLLILRRRGIKQWAVGPKCLLKTAWSCWC